MRILKSVFQIKYWVVAFAGVLFTFAVWQIMALEFRYVLAISGGIMCLSIGMMFISHIEDFLVYTLIFNIPFSQFGKWFFSPVEKILGLPAQGISLGIAEMLILGAYIVWFSQIFIAKRASLPRLQKIDYIILLLIFSQIVSLIGAANKLLGAFDIIYHIKHILIYFFLAHSQNSGY